MCSLHHDFILCAQNNHKKNLNYPYTTVYQLVLNSWANSARSNTTLYDTTIYYTALNYTILYNAILYYVILYYTILYYYYTILYYTTPYCPGSNPGGDKIFRPSRPALGPTQPSAKWVLGLSWGYIATGACCWPLTPFQCRDHGRLELYLYPPSGSHRACNGITLSFTIPYYTILYNTILYYTIPYCTILYYTTPYCSILYYTTLY